MNIKVKSQSSLNYMRKLNLIHKHGVEKYTKELQCPLNAII